MQRYEFWLMGCTIVTSREFNQDVSKAMIDAMKSPVFITDHGQTEHVLLSIKDYQKITSKDKNIAKLLAIPGASDIDFEVPRLNSSSCITLPTYPRVLA